MVQMIYRASKWKSKESPRSSRSSEAWADAYLCLNILKDNLSLLLFLYQYGGGVELMCLNVVLMIRKNNFG